MISADELRGEVVTVELEALERCWKVEAVVLYHIRYILELGQCSKHMETRIQLTNSIYVRIRGRRDHDESINVVIPHRHLLHVAEGRTEMDITTERPIYLVIRDDSWWDHGRSDRS